MFKRLLYEDWQSLIPIVAFALTFFGFLYYCVRALRMSAEKREHMAALPLDLEADLSNDDR